MSSGTSETDAVVRRLYKLCDMSPVQIRVSLQQGEDSFAAVIADLDRMPYAHVRAVCQDFCGELPMQFASRSDCMRAIGAAANDRRQPAAKDVARKLRAVVSTPGDKEGLKQVLAELGRLPEKEIQAVADLQVERHGRATKMSLESMVRSAWQRATTRLSADQELREALERAGKRTGVDVGAIVEQVFSKITA